MSVAVKSKYKFILTFHLFSSYSLPQRIRQTHLETNYILYFPFTFMVEEWRLTYTTVLFLFLLFLPLSHTDVDTCTHIFTALHRHSSVLLLMESGSEGMLHLPLAVISQGITYRHTCIHGSHLLTSMHLQITKDAGCMQSNVITSEDMLFTYKHTHIHTLSFPPADTNIRQATKNWLPSHEIRLKEVYCHSLFKVNEVLISVRLCIHKPSVMNYTVVL